MLADRLCTSGESDGVVFHQTSTLEIHRLLLNDIKTNCFVVQRGDEALLIDPTDHPEAIEELIRYRRRSEKLVRRAFR